MQGQALKTSQAVRRVAMNVLDNQFTRPYVRVLRPSTIPLAAGEIQLARTIQHFNILQVLDIGANRGQYARLLRDRVGYSGEIISVEPGAPQAAELRERAQYDARWTIHELAIGGTTGTQTLNVMNESQFNSLLEPNPDDFLEARGHTLKDRVQVSVVTLEEIFATIRSTELSGARMLKLDTQGTELTILRSGAPILGQFSVIQAEVSFKSIYDKGATFHEVSSYLDEMGFQMGAISAHNIDHFPRLYDADAIFVRADLVE
jgi:FkbM family methyltransferase